MFSYITIGYVHIYTLSTAAHGLFVRYISVRQVHRLILKYVYRCIKSTIPPVQRKISGILYCAIQLYRFSDARLNDLGDQSRGSHLSSGNIGSNRPIYPTAQYIIVLTGCINTSINSCFTRNSTTGFIWSIRSTEAI